MFLALSINIILRWKAYGSETNKVRTRHFIFQFNKSQQNKMFYLVLKASLIITATLVLLTPSITFTLVLYLWAKPKPLGLQFLLKYQNIVETLGLETNKVRTCHFPFQLNKSRQNKMFYLVLKGSVIVTATLVFLPLFTTFSLVLYLCQSWSTLRF